MFNENLREYSAKQGKEIEVFQSPKYVEARKKAKEIIDSGKYDLSESDFWILMNETKSGKMMYSGLIISHNGCLKINDRLEDKLKFNPECVQIDKEGFGNSLVYTYVNKEQGLYEVGEVSKENCKNSYPYAMALKRCFDRVVLKNCRLAYAGVYSDAEADEFQEQLKEVKKEEKMVGDVEINILMALFKSYEEKTKKCSAEDLKKHTLETYKIKDLSGLKMKEYVDILNKLKNDLGGK